MQQQEILAVQKNNTTKETKKQVVCFVGNCNVTIFASKANLYLVVHKRFFNLLPQFSRLGIQGPASHIYVLFLSFCVFMFDMGFWG